MKTIMNVLEKPSNLLKLSLILKLVVSGSAAWSQQLACPNEKIKVNISTPEMDKALNELAQESGFKVVFYSDVVKDIKAKPIKGEYESCEKAIDALLTGTGLRYSVIDDNAVAIYKADQSGALQGKDRLFAANRDGDSSDSQNHLNFVLEEIIVTAQKREQRLFDVPMTISALGGDELDKRGIVDLLDISFAVPELTVFATNPGTPYYALRGIGAVEGDSLVGVYLDEAPITGPSGLQLDIRTTDLERVEVLHGPQGTLYGQGSAGGTIRFITRDPHFDGVEGELNLSVSTVKDGASNHSATGIINLPVVDNIFAIRVAATAEKTGGWIDTSAGRDDVNDQDVINIRAKALWNYNDNLDINAMVVHYRNDAGYGNGAADEDYLLPLPEYAPDIDLPNESDYDIYNLEVSYDLGFAELLSSSTYTEFENKDSFTNFFGATQRHGFRDNRFESHGQEFRLVSNENGNLNWTFGATYDETDFSQELLFTIGLGPDILYENLVFPIDIKSQSWAAFGDVNYQLNSKLNTGVGLRYFEEEKEVPDQSATFDSLDPRLYLTYDLAGNVRIYANVAEGFRSGGFNSLDPSLPKTFDAETVRSYELGSKMSLLEGRVNTEIAVFYSDYLDIQTQVIEAQTSIGYIANVGEAEVKGIDVTLNSKLTDKLSVQFNGNVIDTEMVKIPEGSALAVGDKLNFIPEYSYTLSAIRDIDWTRNISGFIRLDYSEQGKATFSLNNVGIQDESHVVNLLSARTGLNLDNISLEMYASNLLGDNDRMNPSATGLFSRPRPRTLGINANIYF